MEDVESGTIRRRRRKSSRKKPTTWPEYWRSAVFGQHLFGVMSLIAAAYAAMILYETRYYTFNYPPVKIGMSPSEVEYLLGTPDAVEDGGSVTRYSERGRELTVRFGPDGGMQSISCVAGTPAPSTCPEVRGLGIGSHEVDVLRTLGGPSRETFDGEEKTMYYDGIGLTLQMRVLYVTRIEVRDGGGPIGYLARGLFAMVP